MSNTKIKELLRLALYAAYKRKCFYTGEPINYQDFEVDHIIPESRAFEVNQIKEHLKLGDDFHINSIENLVPCRPGINLQKNNHMFSDNTLLLYFEKTKANKAKVLELYSKYQKQRRFGDGYNAIDKILLSGQLRLEDIDAYIHSKIIEQWKNKKIKLVYPINFTDCRLAEVSINFNFRDYLSKTLDLFGDGKGIKLINDDDKGVHIHSLEEWKEYTKKGYYPYSNADIKMSCVFDYLDGLISALEIAQMPKLSYFDKLSMKDLFFRFSTSLLVDFEKELPNTSLGELINKGIVEIEEQDDSSICIRYEGFLNTFSEQFRADLTNDGIENILCYVWRNADGGTMGWGETIILGCHKKDGIIEDEKYENEVHDILFLAE